jgi:ribosome-associated toxin RatA of RatAB toxin-antitoxin module
MATHLSFLMGSANDGRRARARRPLALAIAWLAAATTIVSAASADQVRVDVREEQGTYQVVATFQIPQRAALAMAVLTDYERIPKFMPDVRTSRVLERRDRRVVVEQEAVATFLLFSKQVHLLLEVDEAPLSLEFKDRCLKAFSSYEGSWRLEERPDRTDVTYTLSANPTFEVPGFLVKRLMKGDAVEMIERLRAEIAARAK